MFKTEFDKIGPEVVADAPNEIAMEPNNTINQITILTTATIGTITPTTKARLGDGQEPVFEADGTTPVVIDLASGRRTFLVFAGVKNVQTTASGMNGPYSLASSGGDR